MSKLQSSRFSLIKRWGNISFWDFNKITKEFIDCASPVWIDKTVEIKLFNKSPCSITSWQEDLIEFLHEENKKKIFATYDDLKKVSLEEFQRSQFVEVRINAGKLSTGCSWIEFKGWLPRHVIFYSQPEEAVEYIHGRFLNKARGIYYKIGDGLEENHQITYS